MTRVVTTLVSLAAHAGATSLLLLAGLTFSSTIPPAAPVSVPVTPSVALNLEGPKPTPVFLTENPAPMPLEVQEIPAEFERDPHEVVVVEAIASPAPERPAPSLDRALRPAAALFRMLPSAPAELVRTDEAEVAEVHNPPPVYPALARRRGLEGEVLLELTVLPEGTCGEVCVLEHRGIDAFLDASLQAVRSWIYRPATRAGRAVEATHRVRFVFRLEGGP